MILQFLKNTFKSYFSQAIYALLLSFFVFGYVSEIGFSNIGKTIRLFFTEGGTFFLQLASDSTFAYLYVMPFILPPFFLFWMLGKKYFFKYKVQQINKYTNVHIIHDVIEGIFAAVSYSLQTMILVKLAHNGYGKLYENINDYPLYYLPVSLIACFLVEDAWFYWVHRGLHHKYVYKYIHASHHVSIDSTPFTQNAFNFVEMFLLPIGGLLPTFLFPTYGPLFLGFLLYGGIMNMIAHSGFEFYPSWMLSWKTTSTHHNMHHQYFDGNYGTHFTFWDRVCKTEFYDYEARFKEIKERIKLK